MTGRKLAGKWLRHWCNMYVVSSLSVHLTTSSTRCSPATRQQKGSRFSHSCILRPSTSRKYADGSESRHLFFSGAQHSRAERRADRRREAMSQVRGAEHVELAMLRPWSKSLLVLRHSSVTGGSGHSVKEYQHLGLPRMRAVDFTLIEIEIKYPPSK